ncbi:MAG TPA: aminodeoxychorismate/anthranilate synthase component II [Clostridia bacterium]
MILLIDNYDSFTYNVLQLIGGLGEDYRDIRVIRNDHIDVNGIRALAPSHLVISPGPGYPAAAGVSVTAVRELSGRLPILGICLGHQAVCEAFGARIVHAPRIMHGKRDKIRLEPDCSLFAGLPEEILAGRYHSLAVDPDTLPDCLRVAARASDGSVMAVGHVAHPTFGLQFHPESILTERGADLVRNFLRMAAN